MGSTSSLLTSSYSNFSFTSVIWKVWKILVACVRLFPHLFVQTELKQLLKLFILNEWLIDIVQYLGSPHSNKKEYHQKRNMTRGATF